MGKKMTKPIGQSQLIGRVGLKGDKLLRRRMSVKGAIKKTRSIAVDGKTHFL